MLSRGPAPPSGDGRDASRPGGARARRGGHGDDAPAEPLAELVARALEGLEREGPPALEALCREHPSQATALRARVEQLRAIGFVGAPSKDAPLPERVGGFRILSRLGGGGMGVVFLAEQEGLQRQVALKLVRPDLLYFPGARERFAREVEAVARLSHPGIVPVYAGGEDNGIPFYAMEHVRGASLEELVAALAGRDPSQLSGAHLKRAVEQLVRRRESAAGGAGSASPPLARASGSGRASASGAGEDLFAGTWSAACLRIARATALALQHAHAQGVLHRDVKPSNIMLTPDGRVLLLDFGLAAAEGSERLTGSGAQLGSLAWMSPEQVRGEHATLDARTDVYSLGVTLHELLTLRSPFTGGDLELTRRRILDGRPIPLRDLNAAVPRDAETVCQRAMDPERERRYADAEAFAQDLDNALALRPVLARRAGLLLKARRWAQRHPARAVASLLGTVLLVGGPAGYAVLQSRAAERQRELNEELSAGREELQRSLAEVTRQREASERGYQRTLTAIDQMLWQVGSRDLQDLPGFEDTRIALLERALAFYRELATEQPGDVVPRIEHARTQRSIADILFGLGRYDEAAATFADVVATLRGLHAADPADAELQHMLAGCLSQVGVAEQRDGRLDAARATFAEALALIDELLERPDPSPSFLRDHVVVCVNLARLANDSGDDEQELQYNLRGVETGTRLVAEHPESVDYAVLLAGALKGAATAGVALGRAEECEGWHRAAWEALSRLRAGHPHDRALRLELVESANNFGLLLMSRPDRTEALAVLQAGLEAAESLAQDFPREPTYRRNAAVLALNLSAELGNQKRYAEAAPLIERSCEQLAPLVADDPGNVEDAYFLAAALSVASGMHLNLGDSARGMSEALDAVQRMREVRAALGGSTEVASQLASVLFQLADVQRATGAMSEALATCEEACLLGGGRPDILFQGAEITGHLAADARGRSPGEGTGGDAAASEPVAAGDDAARADVAARAEELCLALLDEAVSKGFTDARRLRDAVFLSLQGVQAFEEIVARIGPGT